MRRLWLFLLFSVFAHAQTPDPIVAGPYGVPRLVKTEFGAWSEPIQVFANNDKVAYVPDITNPGWAQWHTQEFKQKGVYFTYVYTYLRKERVTVQDLVYVDTHAQHVVVQRFLKSPLQIDLHHTAPGVSATITNITRIVQDSIDHFNGSSIQSVIRSDRQTTADIVGNFYRGR